jgi:transposase
MKKRSNDKNGNQATTAAKRAADFPPAGWVTNREAAQMLGVGLTTLTCNAWRWRLRCGKTVRMPGGGRCAIYPLAEIERVQRARAEASEVKLPDGYVDRDGACKMFGLSPAGWKNWIRDGKVRFGTTFQSPTGGKRKMYAVEDLNRLREKLFGKDKLYKGRDQTWHVPAGFIRREEAWEKFGVSHSVWERWEREGKITCGIQVSGGPKLYKVQDIERMLDEYGRWAPPYPDPDRPGVYRVPLSGRDIKRREALIDADALPLVEGASCSWSMTDGSGFVALSRGDVHGTPLRRVILGVSDRALNVRHVNGDPLDCRRENLVVRTVRERSRNARKMRTVKGRPTSSQFKGVFWETYTKKWRAVIRVDGKNRSLGRFGDQLAAAVAYDEAARKFFGPCAWLNFPEGVDRWLEQHGFHPPTPGPLAA